MKAHDQLLGPAVGLPEFGDASGLRLDVGRVVVEALDEAQRRLVAQAPAWRVTASTTVAVVLAAYCGYSGTARM